jgi:myosin heavy subunit
VGKGGVKIFTQKLYIANNNATTTHCLAIMMSPLHVTRMTESSRWGRGEPLLEVAKTQSSPHVPAEKTAELQKKWADAFSDDDDITATTESMTSDDFTEASEDDWSSADGSATFIRVDIYGDATSVDNCSQDDDWSCADSLAYSYTTQDERLQDLEKSIASLNKKCKKYKKYMKRNKKLQEEFQELNQDYEEQRLDYLHLRQEYALLKQKQADSQSYLIAKNAVAQAMIASRSQRNLLDDEGEIQELKKTIALLEESLRRKDYVFATMSRTRHSVTASQRKELKHLELDL